MSSDTKYLFVLDDDAARVRGDALETFFGENAIRHFQDVKDLIEALNKDQIPEYIIFDCTYEDTDERTKIARENNRWGIECAKTVYDWFLENRAEHALPDFLFYSIILDRAEESRDEIRALQGPKQEVYAFMDHEIDLALTLYDRQPTAGAEEGNSSGFREFLKQAIGVDLPITRHEMSVYRESFPSLSPVDILAQVQDGYMSREDGLTRLHQDAIKEISRAYIPQVINIGAREDVAELVSCRSRFAKSAGYSATGYAAFSIKQVNALHNEGKKAVLFLNKYTKDFIPHLKKIAGLVLLNHMATGHLETLVVAFGSACVIDSYRIREDFPFVRGPKGSVRPLTKILIASESDDISYADYTSSMMSLASAHRNKFVSNADKEQQELGREQISELEIDYQTLKPLSCISYGDPVTLEINPEGSFLYPRTLDISVAAPATWLHSVYSRLYEWHEENEVTPLDIRATTDDPQSDYRGDIGLVRTEHHVLQSEELTDLFMKAVLCDDLEALAALPDLFYSTLKTDAYVLPLVGGHSVSIRLLDMPLNEVFNEDDLISVKNKFGREDDIRGVQLGLLCPELYKAQISAIFSLMRYSIEDKKSMSIGDDTDIPHPKIAFNLPNVSSAQEVRDVFQMVEDGAHKAGFSSEDFERESMVETLAAGENIESIAVECDGLNIGSNDLSAAILEYERENYRQREDIMRRKRQRVDPAIRIYPEVITWMEDVVKRARKANPDIRISLCGRHAEDIESLNALRALELDSVSVLPTKRNLTALRMQYAYDTFMRGYHALEHS